MQTVMTDSWQTYPKIYALGHKVIQDILKDEVLIQEKVDGSQFSFGLFEDGLRCKSKSCDINIGAPEKLFEKAVEVVKTLDLKPGWTYRAEYLAKPKHNTLAYNRIPANHLMVFDINDGCESYLPPLFVAGEVARLGLECVPTISCGKIDDISKFKDLLDRESALGGQKIEGVVVKNYSRYASDGKVLMGKFVSEGFKEIHQKNWKEGNPTNKDVVFLISEKLKTPARWNKALHHLRDAGKLTGSLKDIPEILKEVQADIKAECMDEITNDLLKFALPHIMRNVVKGVPEWYKEELLKNQFEQV